MAGIAISSFAKMKGLVAMAMAWAAFCIPTSITTVRRCSGLFFTRRERREEQAMAIRIQSRQISFEMHRNLTV